MGSHGLARICADDGIQRCYRLVVPGYVFDIATNKDTASGVGGVYSPTDYRSRQSELTERRQQDMIRNALMLRAEVIAVLRPFHADPAGHRPDPHARAAAPAGDLICRRPLGFDTSR